LWALPGLAFRIFSDPFSMYFNSIFKLKPIFWSDLISFFIYSLFIGFLILDKSFSLKYLLFSFNFYFLIKLLYLIFAFKISTKKMNLNN
jgi:O-antigen/teichoic acid export membrane protein